MLHYAINRPVGCTRGEGDLAPILPWLRRYREWLEDRVRVNRYRNAFLWKVTVQGASESELRRRRSELMRPPPPGSVIVTNEGERWETVNPQVQAQEAESDGKALRLIVAAGAGVPLHFLAEGESATRATAAEMGDPTFRHYRQRQMFFCHVLEDVALVALRRAALIGKGPLVGVPVEREPRIVAEAGDITRDDNLRLAQAAREITGALAVMASTAGWTTRRRGVGRIVSRARRRGGGFNAEDAEGEGVTTEAQRLREEKAGKIRHPAIPSSPRALPVRHPELVEGSLSQARRSVWARDPSTSCS